MTSPTLQDLHTHTWRCKHARGIVSDYAAVAVRRGITVLGVSDHVPLPDGAWPAPRMAMEELPAYRAEIEAARRAHPRLTILAGFECEYLPRYESYYREELLGRLGFDYLIAGQHNYPSGSGEEDIFDKSAPRDLEAYAASVEAAMESRLFAFIAHPDVFAHAGLEWDPPAEIASRRILSAAERHGVPLEVNGYGFRKPAVRAPGGKRPPYPWAPFWELAKEYRFTVCFNSDAHRPQDVGENREDALAMVAGSSFAEMDIFRRLAEMRPASTR